MPSQKKTFFLIDAMAMAFRNFHAFGAKQITTSNGLPTSAVFGSARFLMKLLNDFNPDYTAVATDTSEPTFRHRLYPAYKANRGQMPEELAVQIPYLYQLFEGLHLPLLRIPGVEADDIIGTLATRFASPEVDVYIVSGDKDFSQLVNENVFLLSPQKGDQYLKLGINEVIEKFGALPSQMIDALAMIGDSSDNIPGLPGVGPKGAAQLLKTFGSLDKVYESLSEIPEGKRKEALIQYQEQVYLAKQLVTIEKAVPLEATLDSFQFEKQKSFASKSLLELFEKLEFGTLSDTVRDNLAKDASSSFQRETRIDVKDSLKAECVDNSEKLAAVLTKIENADIFSFDTETTGLDIITSVPIGYSFSIQSGQGFYIPAFEGHTKIPTQEVHHRISQLIKNLRPAQMIVAHNFKYDLQMLANVGVSWPHRLADSMLASYLLEPTKKSHSLDACSFSELGITKIKTQHLLDQSTDGTMCTVPLDQLSYYACEDAECTLQLFKKYLPRLESEGLLTVFDQIECRLVPVLAKMEQRGVYVNKDQLETYSTELGEELESLEKSIYQMANRSFNINSPKQLGEILFDEMKIHELLGVTKLKKTKSGYATDVSVLEKLTGHPIAQALLEYRSASKLKNTYVDTLPDLIHPKTGRIHTHFHQTGTSTGRLSSSEPNLQNIPIRTPKGKRIRHAFQAQNAAVKQILSADYSQIELRILAHVTGDESLLNAFRQNRDIHKETAAKIFSTDNVTPEQRSQAKTINFGILYGMGPQRLARENQISVKEAQAFIKNYFEQFPKIEGYIKKSKQKALEEGCTRTLLGRKRPLPEIQSDDAFMRSTAENIAVNAPIQGTAADLIKIAMIQIDASLESQQKDIDMLIQVHDELIFEITSSKSKECADLIRTSMETAILDYQYLDVPLKVDVGTGSHWAEAHS